MQVTLICKFKSNLCKEVKGASCIWEVTKRTYLQSNSFAEQVV